MFPTLFHTLHSALYLVTPDFVYLYPYPGPYPCTLLVYKYNSCVLRILSLNITFTSLILATSARSLNFNFILHLVCFVRPMHPPWTSVHLNFTPSDPTWTLTCPVLVLSDPPQTSVHLTLAPLNLPWTLSILSSLLCQLLVWPTCGRQIVNLSAGLDSSSMALRHVQTLLRVRL